MKTVKTVLTMLIAIILASRAASSASQASPADIKQIQSDIRTMINNMNKRTYTKNIDYFWPDLVERTGGREKISVAVKTIGEGIAKMNIRHSKPEFRSAPKFYRNGKRRFAIIPFLVTVKADEPRQTNRVEMYYLGVKESRTARWTYVDSHMFHFFDPHELMNGLPQDMTVPKNRVISSDLQESSAE